MAGEVWFEHTKYWRLVNEVRFELTLAVCCYLNISASTCWVSDKYFPKVWHSSNWVTQTKASALSHLATPQYVRGNTPSNYTAWRTVRWARELTSQPRYCVSQQIRDYKWIIVQLVAEVGNAPTESGLWDPIEYLVSLRYTWVPMTPMVLFLHYSRLV